MGHPHAVGVDQISGLSVATFRLMKTFAAILCGLVLAAGVRAVGVAADVACKKRRRRLLARGFTPAPKSTARVWRVTRHHDDRGEHAVGASRRWRGAMAARRGDGGSTDLARLL